jgi:hypothetical protein
MRDLVPTRWGDDSLSEFIENAIQNCFATFSNLRPQYLLLAEIDKVFRSIQENLNHTQEWFPAFFLLRAHSAYLGSARLGLSGQVPEAYMVLRGCLENSLYGLYLSHNPASQETWLRRHDDEESKKQVRNKFAVGALMRFLESLDPKSHKVVSLLYELTIDFGAHPNERALTSTLQQSEMQDSIRFDLIYLTGNTPLLHMCLKNTGQIGICSLDIFRNVFKERYDLLGVTGRLDKLRKGL